MRNLDGGAWHAAAQRRYEIPANREKDLSLYRWRPLQPTL